MWCWQLRSRGVASFEVTQAAARAFQDEMQTRLSQSVWITGATRSRASKHQGGSGVVESRVKAVVALGISSSSLAWLFGYLVCPISLMPTINLSSTAAGGCTSWYTNLGKTTTLLWPGTIREFEDRCAKAARQLDALHLRDKKGERMQVTLPKRGARALACGACTRPLR